MNDVTVFTREFRVKVAWKALFFATQRDYRFTNSRLYVKQGYVSALLMVGQNKTGMETAVHCLALRRAQGRENNFGEYAARCRLYEL